MVLVLVLVWVDVAMDMGVYEGPSVVGMDWVLNKEGFAVMPGSRVCSPSRVPVNELS